MKSSCTNYCINGNCSGCGNCCTELIPLTINEVKLIKAYIKEKHIKPYSDIFFNYNGQNSVNLMCPFRDFDTKSCRVYEVRPKICRVFKCNQDDVIVEKHKRAAHGRANYNRSVNIKKPIIKVYSTRELIYENKLDTIRIIVGNLYRMRKPIDNENVITMLKEFGRDDLAKQDLVNKVITEYKSFMEEKNEEIQSS